MRLADGHTLLLITSTNAINTALYDNLSFNVVRDIAAVAQCHAHPICLGRKSIISRPKLFPIYRLRQGQSGQGQYGVRAATAACPMSPASCSRLMTGVNVVHVPYRGSTPAHMDLIGGQVQVMFDAMTSSLEHIKSGRLRVLGVTSATRSELLPNVPTVGDFVSGYEVSAWLGIGAPDKHARRGHRSAQQRDQLGACRSQNSVRGLLNWAAVCLQRRLTNLQN